MNFYISEYILIMQRISFINSNNTQLVNDFDLEKISSYLTKNQSWVMFTDQTLKSEFSYSWGVMQPWKAVIKCIRTASAPIPSQLISVIFESDTTVNLPVVIWNKVYIEIDNSLLQDPTQIIDIPPATNFALGLNIGQIKSTPSYPAHPNYIPLYEITAWPTQTDVRPALLIDGTRVDNTVLLEQISEQIQNGVNTYDVSSGAVNNYEVTYDPLPATVEQSAVYFFKSHQTNTGSAFFKLNTTWAPVVAEIKKYHDQGLQAGDIENGQQVQVKYDGTFFQMMSQIGQVQSQESERSTIIGEAWEDILAGQPLFVGDGNVVNKDIIEVPTSGGAYNMWDGTSIRIQQGFIGFPDNIVRSIRIWLRKVWNPWDSAEVRIYASDRTTLLWTSTNTVLWSGLTGTFVKYTFTLPNTVATTGEIFYFEVRRTAGQNGSNYYQIEAGDNNWAFGNLFYFDWGNWIIYNPGSLYFQIQTGNQYLKEKWYLADSSNTNTAKVDGIAEESKTTGQLTRITVAWSNDNQLYQKAGSEIYLNNEIIWETQTLFNTTTFFWYQVSNQEKISQSIQLNKSINIDKILLRINKVNNPTDNVVVRIESDSNGVPSGTLIDPNAILTISWGAILQNLFSLKYLFPDFFTIPAETTCHILFQRSGALDTTNYYQVGIQNSNVYTQWTLSTYSNGIWTATTSDLFFDFLEQYNWLTQIVNQNNEQFFWISTADREKQVQAFMLDRDTDISSIMVQLRNVWTPTDNVEIRIETWAQGYIEQANQVWNINNAPFGFGSWSTSFASPFRLSWSQTNFILNQIKIYASRIGSPIDSLNIRIETDSAWLPSGTAIANGTASILWSSLTTSTVEYTLNFTGPITLVPWVIYHLVAIRSWAFDLSNYYNIWFQSWGCPFQLYLYNGTSRVQTWVNNGLNYIFPEIELWPSGTLVDVNAVATIAWNTLTTTLTRYFLDFLWSFSLVKNTQYFIVVQRNWTLSWTNYYGVWQKTDANFPFGLRYIRQNWINVVQNEARAFQWHFFSRYAFQKGWLTTFPNSIPIVLWTPVTNVNFLVKVWNTVSGTELVIDKVIRVLDKKQTGLMWNTWYFAPFGWYAYATTTYVWWSGTIYQVYVRLSDDWVTYRDVTPTSSNNTGWCHAYIPKWKYFVLQWNTNHTGGTGGFNWDFYLQ